MKKITIEFAGEDGDVDREVRQVMAVKDAMSFLASWEQYMREQDKYGPGDKVDWGDVRKAYYQMKDGYNLPDED